MNDNIRPFTGIQIQRFELDDEEINEIKRLNTRMNSISSLIDELQIASDFIIDKLIDRYVASKTEYDEWFVELESKLEITPNPDQKWSIDFKEKVAKLIG